MSPGRWSSPERSEAETDEAGASSAASNREKRKRVSYGDATSYSAAEPSIAPSAIAVVLKRPSDG